MKKMITIIILVAIMTGCASLVSKTSYPVSFNSDPSGSKLVITDSMGKEIYAGMTPAVVELKGKDGFFSGASYTITMSKEGYDEKSILISSKIDGWYWGNILFGGLIGMLIIDPMTGAMWALPEESNATLTRSIALQDNAKRELKFVSITDLPDAYLDNLIELN